MTFTISRKALGLAAVAVIAAMAMAGCGGGKPAPPATITSHGTMAVDYSQGLTGGGDPFDTGSTQVVVLDSHSTVIDSTTLTIDGGHGLGGFGFEDDYKFTVKVPANLPRYGLQVGGPNHGTIWETPAQMRQGPALTLDLTGNGLGS